jgi:phytoene dehydrogenase-like protein
MARSGGRAISTGYDVVVIGAGHNRLTRACYVAKAGLKMLVLERYHDVGGMTLTEELTLPGFRSERNAAETIFSDLGLDFGATFATGATKS